jgi:hypothetical protein
MNRPCRSCLSGLTIVLLASAWAYGAVGVCIRGVGIERMQFGVVLEADEGAWSLQEMRHIPFKPGTMIGWRIRLRDPQKVTWREEFILPRKPKVWETGPQTRLERGGTVAVTEKTVRPRYGWIRNAWVISEGDPPGAYLIRIYVQGTLVKAFEFTLEE